MAFTFLSLVTVNCSADVELDWYCIQYKIVDCEVGAEIQLCKGFLRENIKKILEMSLAIKCYLRILLSVAFDCYLTRSVVYFSQNAWFFFLQITLPAEKGYLRITQSCFYSLSCLRIFLYKIGQVFMAFFFLLISPVSSQQQIKKFFLHLIRFFLNVILLHFLFLPIDCSPYLPLFFFEKTDKPNKN